MSEEMTAQEILGIIANKIFFRGGLKIKDVPETAKNARSLPSLVNYLQESRNKNKDGAIGWFLKKECNENEPEDIKKAFEDIKGILDNKISDNDRLITIVKRMKSVWDAMNIKSIQSELPKQATVLNIIKEWTDSVGCEPVVKTHVKHIKEDMETIKKEKNSIFKRSKYIGQNISDKLMSIFFPSGMKIPKNNNEALEI